jgi:hypothetical protein
VSKEVDFTKALSREDRAYLLMRGRQADIDRLDNNFGATDEDLLDGDGSGPATKQLATGLALEQRKQELLDELAQIEAAETDAEGGVDDDTEVPPYEVWAVKELDAELKRRGLPVTGDKTAKAAALYADDDDTEN